MEICQQQIHTEENTIEWSPIRRNVIPNGSSELQGGRKGNKRSEKMCKPEGMLFI
jgi:hypothetical protein